MKIFIKRYQVERKWDIVGFPNYFFGSDKKLYNAQTLRILKRCLVGYTQGYYLHGRFYSLVVLRPLIKKTEE